jgi:hypothetical protein
MRRKIDYLFLRPGSRSWHIRLQAPGKRVEKSLGTPDRMQAELLALPLIAEHKAALLATRPRLERDWVSLFPPGLHVGPDGGRLFATDRRIDWSRPMFCSAYRLAWKCRLPKSTRMSAWSLPFLARPNH